MVKVFFGATYLWNQSKETAWHVTTTEMLHWFDKGACAPECEDEWLENSSFGGIAFYDPNSRDRANFKITDIISGGILVTRKSQCKGAIEGVIFVDVLAMTGLGKRLGKLLKYVGAELKAGVQGNIGVEVCKGETGVLQAHKHHCVWAASLSSVGQDQK